MLQTTPSISMTGKQKRDIRDLLHDALDEMGFSNKDRAQTVLGNGGRLKTGVKDVLNKLCSSNLLEPVGTTIVPAIKTFRAKEHFKDDRSGPVVIGWFGDNFSKVFLAGDGLVEGAVAEAMLRIHKLVKASVDGPIIAELGETLSETTLGQMYEMMKAQGHGEQGILLTNDYANIFYIRDTDNVLWAVYCRWRSGSRGWSVGASPVARPFGWGAGVQVVSR